MMAQQSAPIERNSAYFFSATVTVNEFEEHAIFDIRWRKNPADGSMQFYSSDVPPVPIKGTTSLKVVFYVENSIGVTPVKYKLGELQFLGSSLEVYTANPHNVSSSSKSELTLVVTNEPYEWHFFKKTEPPTTGNWMLSYISMKIPYGHVRRFFQAAVTAV